MAVEVSHDHPLHSQTLIPISQPPTTLNLSKPQALNPEALDRLYRNVEEGQE